jgi:Spy/CpxP family protein refolding chaperone
MKILFRKTILFALVAALCVAALPFVSASAAGEYDPADPQRQIPDERLERIWARQLRIYERMGWADEFAEKTQEFIDRARENGKDVSAVQSALDAFESALKEAQPVYQNITGLVDSHQGFDEAGKVTDSEQARQTIDAMREKFQEIKDVMDGTRKALHQAIEAFREANPRPQPTPTTTQ